jgi:hypothetical protein
MAAAAQIERAEQWRDKARLASAPSSRRPSSPTQPTAPPVATREQLQSRLRGGEGPVPNPSGGGDPAPLLLLLLLVIRRATRSGLLGGYGVDGGLLEVRRQGAWQASDGGEERIGRRRGACTSREKRGARRWESGRGINEESVRAMSFSPF